MVAIRLLAEVGKRERGKGKRFGIFPFPFNLFPFPTRVQKAMKALLSINEHGQLLPFKIDISFYSPFPQRVSIG